MSKKMGLMMFVLLTGGSACSGDAFTTFPPGTTGGSMTGGTAGGSGSNTSGGSSGTTGGNSGQSGKGGDGPGGNSEGGTAGDAGNSGSSSEGGDAGDAGSSGSSVSGSGGSSSEGGNAGDAGSGGSSNTGGATGGQAGEGGQAGMGGSSGSDSGGSSGTVGTGGQAGDAGNAGSGGQGGSGGDPCMSEPVPNALTISCTNACMKILVFNGGIIEAKSSADNDQCEDIPFTNKPSSDDSVYIWINADNAADLDMFKATSLGSYPKTCFMKCKVASPDPGPAPDHSEMEAEIFSGGYITVPCGSNPEISLSQTCAFGMNVIAQY